MRTSCCVWWYKFHPSSSKFFLTELEITIFYQNWQVSQGCHSNGPIYHDEILQVYSTYPGVHLMSLHQTPIYNSLGAISESLIFQRLWAEIRNFSPKTYLLLQFWRYRSGNRLIRNVMILRKTPSRGLCNFVLVAEKMAVKVTTVAQKWSFSRLPWKRNIRNANFWHLALPRHALSAYAKFHCAPTSRLAKIVWTDRQTSQVAPRTSASGRAWQPCAEEARDMFRTVTSMCIHFVPMNQHGTSDVQMAQGQQPGAHRFRSFRVARG